MNWMKLILPGLFVLLAGCDQRQPTQNSDHTGPDSAVQDNSSTASGDGDSRANPQQPSASGNAIEWPSNIEPTNVDMTLMQVAPHSYYVQGPPGTPTDNDGFMSNAGVVITSQGVIVFDALGTPSLAYKLYARLREITDQPVKKVVVSHYHADHIYGLQVFKDMGAEIIAPAGAKSYLDSPSAEQRLKERRESLFPWVDENTRLVTPDRFISEDTEFSLGDINIKLILLGSTHSQGDLMMRVDTDNVLYSGDLIFEGRIPFVAGSNPEQWLQRLSTLDTNDLKVIVPGHGPAPDKPENAVSYTTRYLQHLHDSMGEAVENLTPFDEAYKNTDWSSYKKEPAFQVNRMNAYFVYLRLEAQSMQ